VTSEKYHVIRYVGNITWCDCARISISVMHQINEIYLSRKKIEQGKRYEFSVLLSLK